MAKQDFTRAAVNDETGHCKSCGRDNRGYEGKPCADDCPMYWEEVGIMHPDYPGRRQNPIRRWRDLLMSMVPRCVVCDSRLDAYGRDGAICHECELDEERTHKTKIYTRLIAEAEAREHARINETLAPAAMPPLGAWEIVVCLLVAAFIGFILATGGQL